MSTDIADVPSHLVDVHAHYLPPCAHAIPLGDQTVDVAAESGSIRIAGIHLGLCVETMSDVSVVLAQMDQRRIPIRLLSPPPFAMPLYVHGPRALAYAREFNQELNEACMRGEGRLFGLGVVPLSDATDAKAVLAEIAELRCLLGVAIPPLLESGSLDVDPLRSILQAAAEHDLAVLVHPTQRPVPELARHYLSNLIGNLHDSSIAIASLLFGDVMTDAPGLRIAFVHGGGGTPALLGRWDHGWRVRGEFTGSTTSPPSERARGLFYDTLTHGHDEARALVARIGMGSLLLGSDFPFDMGDEDPVSFAVAAGMDLGVLADNSARFLTGHVTPGRFLDLIAAEKSHSTRRR